MPRLEGRPRTSESIKIEQIGAVFIRFGVDTAPIFLYTIDAEGKDP